MTKQIVLPDDLFDALHLASLAFGGIIADAQWRDVERGIPGCLGGYVGFLDGQRGYCMEQNTECFAALNHAFGGSYWAMAAPNNAAIDAINLRRGKRREAPVDFLDLAAELNLVPQRAVSA